MSGQPELNPGVTGTRFRSSLSGFAAVLGPVAIAAAAQCGSAVAAPTGPCAGIDDDSARLACHDLESGRSTKITLPVLGTQRPVQDSEHLSDEAGASSPFAASTGSLSAIWELDAEDKRGRFRLVPHKANYLLPARFSNNVGTSPSSPAPGHGLDVDLPLQATEAKFQVSLKIKAWENIFGDNGDLWLAYTQQSNWQLYNQDISSPFRETVYEPEAILSLRTGYDFLGWRWKLLNLGYVHQSNGRPLPFSRSWNRLYAQFGFERGNWTVLARPWLRLPEPSESDDNPDIRRYMGSGDLRIAYQRNESVYSILGRYSTSGGRGAVQVDWAFPLAGKLRGYLQVTSGYGESLIDYNHSQTTIGVGLLLLPWQ